VIGKNRDTPPKTLARAKRQKEPSNEKGGRRAKGAIRRESPTSRNRGPKGNVSTSQKAQQIEGMVGERSQIKGRSPSEGAERAKGKGEGFIQTFSIRQEETFQGGRRKRWREKDVTGGLIGLPPFQNHHSSDEVVREDASTNLDRD